MKTSNYIVQIIEPSEGWLTQTHEVEIQDRLFSKKIFLALNDKMENWKEITDEEYHEYQLQLEEYKKAKTK